MLIGGEVRNEDLVVPARRVVAARKEKPEWRVVAELGMNHSTNPFAAQAEPPEERDQRGALPPSPAAPPPQPPSGEATESPGGGVPLDEGPRVRREEAEGQGVRRRARGGGEGQRGRGGGGGGSGSGAGEAGGAAAEWLGVAAGGGGTGSGWILGDGTARGGGESLAASRGSDFVWAGFVGRKGATAHLDQQNRICFILMFIYFFYEFTKYVAILTFGQTIPVP